VQCMIGHKALGYRFRYPHVSYQHRWCVCVSVSVYAMQGVCVPVWRALTIAGEHLQSPNINNQTSAYVKGDLQMNLQNKPTDNLGDNIEAHINTRQKRPIHTYKETCKSDPLSI